MSFKHDLQALLLRAPYDSQANVALVGLVQVCYGGRCAPIPAAWKEY